MLGMRLTRLSPENLIKALQIVSQNNPTFQPNTVVVDLDINAQSNDGRGDDANNVVGEEIVCVGAGGRGGGDANGGGGSVVDGSGW
ncbi:hypothetical protein RIF29_04042 [Crotalaria pallida]|uniref:NET domain-containing protein n=1 Tax=Crotalaria pallida TaxID=3830 RepID=A0AAN9P937_CROPI